MKKAPFREETSVEWDFIDIYPADFLRFKLNLDSGITVFDLMGIAFAEFKPVDAFSLLIGGVLFEGEKTRLFGSLDDFDVVFFEVKGYF